MDPSSPVQGSPAMVGVRIHNQGGTEARNFKVVRISGEPGDVVEWTVTSLAAGDTKWCQGPYTYTGHGHFNTTAEVDVDTEVDELDEDNNTASYELTVAP